VAAEKALGLVLRTTDWSETSRIATIWTREFGKVRALAKGGRRLKSSFESALDLLTLCSIVLLRKASGSLDLLTEAQVIERFAHLRTNLTALYAGYYIAELLSEWTQDYDPHPALFDESVAALRDFSTQQQAIGPRLARFELVLLRELGYSPALAACAGCGEVLFKTGLFFSPAAGGVVCGTCAKRYRDARPIRAETWQALRRLGEEDEAWQRPLDPAVGSELRQVLGHYVTYLLGRRPRLLPYLGN
jgi:DNA repair protein RecO (recombination protein O)